MGLQSPPLPSCIPPSLALTSPVDLSRFWVCLEPGQQAATGRTCAHVPSALGTEQEVCLEGRCATALKPAPVTSVACWLISLNCPRS